MGPARDAFLGGLVAGVTGGIIAGVVIAEHRFGRAVAAELAVLVQQGAVRIHQAAYY